MGALANAAALTTDPTFISWCTAAAAYQARQVILEADTVTDHSVRLHLAQNVITFPGLIGNAMTLVIGTDPAVASAGATAALVGEATVLSKAAEVWTAMAKIMYPRG